MADELAIRTSTPDDVNAIELLYPQAFPDEDLLPLVRDLLPDTTVVTSLVATRDSQLAGHGVFTECGVSESNTRAALLGPLAVAPEHQKQGVGSAIVRDGLRRMTEQGVAFVLVLGDPAYYGRFGFRPEASIEPPYPLPAEWKDAWQSIRLDDGAEACSGVLAVPPPWREAALWGP